MIGRTLESQGSMYRAHLSQKLAGSESGKPERLIMRSDTSAAPLRSNPAWTGGSPPAVVSGNQCKPTCTTHSCRGKEVAVLKRGALAAAGCAQAVRGARAPRLGEPAGGDLAEGSHPGTAGDLILPCRRKGISCKMQLLLLTKNATNLTIPKRVSAGADLPRIFELS